MKRKKIIILSPYFVLFMPTPRFLTRLRHHSSSQSPIPSPTFTLSHSSDPPNKLPHRPRPCPCFQFNPSSLLRPRPAQGFFISPFAYRAHILPNRSSPLFSSLASTSLDTFHRSFFTRAKEIKKIEVQHDHSQRAVTTALWCNFLVFSLKFGVWWGTSSHVMLAEVVHSAADFANQALLAYGLSSSRRAPDALHPYGYSKERFVWSLISAVGIFCLGSGATIVHGIQNLWTSQPPANIQYAALVIGGSFLIEGASLIVAIHAVRKGAAAEGMKVRDYVWRGHDPTSVAVMTEDGAAVTGLLIAAASLVAVNTTGNAIYDPIGSIIVGNLLGMVVDSVYDCKSEVIGPGFFRFKAEIDFNGVVLVQNYLKRTGREEWARQFREAANEKDDAALLKVMSLYGEEVVTALGSEVDRLEKEIQGIVPGIRHVDIEAHNPIVPSP